MVTSKKGPRGRQKVGTPRAAKKAKPAKRTKATADTCQATTVKGTQCRLKAQEGASFCARHAASETDKGVKPSPATPAMKNGQGRSKRRPSAKKTAAAKPSAKMAPHSTDDKQATNMDQPEPTATTAPTTTAKKRTVKKQVEKTVQQTEAETAAQDHPSVDEKQETPEEDPEDHDSFYGSEFSTTMEASPYDDMITTEMAEGEEEVELRDEREFGRDRQAPKRPRITREDAEKKVRERLGPRPEIAPEEDLDETLAKYDRRFENEVRRVMGIAPPGRGRRGGRRRGRSGGGGGGGPQQGGPGRGGGGRRRRGRRGGRARQGGGPPGSGGPPSKRRSGPTGGAARKVGRDSPLAQKRSSQGPKRGVQPRRRRDPDV